MLSRTQLGDKITAAIAPKAWAAYQRSRPKGTMANMDGWALLEAIDAAGRVMDMLHDAGYPVPAKKKSRRAVDRSPRSMR
jgi:hypothetical protein